MDELEEYKLAQIRGLVSSPGWAYVTEILVERKARLSRSIMIPSELRPDGLSDDRIRGEFLILSLLLDNPAKLIESYDNVVGESRTQPEEDRWVEFTNQLGMRGAGFPTEPTSDERQPV